MILIDRFSPSHLSLAYILDAIGSRIYKIIKSYIDGKNVERLDYFNFFIFLILFVAAMIHNEIIIIIYMDLILKPNISWIKNSKKKLII